MDKPQKYATAMAFRRALEDRLKLIAEKERVALERLRREVAFDRLLARLFGRDDAPWVLKGGYALEVRIKQARATRDIDLALRHNFGKTKGTALNDEILKALRAAAALDLEDFFQFEFGDAMMNLDAVPYGGARFPVTALMDRRVFIKFHIDVGAGDVLLAPLDTTEGRDWLKFAGIPAAKFPTITKEQHFAEKVHAYTLPRPSANSRVRDMVDMVLLITSSPKLDPPLVKKAIDATFERRKTHAMPNSLQPPPADWRQPYAALTRECGLSEDLDAAFRLLAAYLNTG
ncbi:MAG: nucleotidyl transferase AbiEii/AbiGii toxin family protein [Elusimicrobia bacterium]|nr:nucleotidyl transferase AbiEii/AbiGii toxin family protein [Elusimicrobiota bacterium]